MTSNNERIIGRGLSNIFTRPSAAVKKFATDSLEYALQGQEEIINRLPLWQESMVNAANLINRYGGGIDVVIMSGSLAERSLTNLKDYEYVMANLKEMGISTYNDFRRKIESRHHDLDHALFLEERQLTEDEKRQYRNKTRVEFTAQMRNAIPKNLNFKDFYPDAHYDSTLMNSQFKRIVKDSEERLSNSEEYALFIESLDKPLQCVIDIRDTKPETPVVVYRRDRIDPETIEILNARVEKGTLQTREKWYETSWLEAENELEKVLAEQQKEDKDRIKEEIAQGIYGDIKITNTMVLQKLGLV